VEICTNHVPKSEAEVGADVQVIAAFIWFGSPPNLDELKNTFVATIDWGDGTISVDPGVGVTNPPPEIAGDRMCGASDINAVVLGSEDTHVYGSPGLKMITVTVTGPATGRESAVILLTQPSTESNNNPPSPSP
jgi:hypothetical protein